MTLLIQIGIVVGLLLVGFLFSTLAEKRHYAKIIKDEMRLNQLPAMSTRLPPENQLYRHQLVSGNIVVANDYFKFFTAALRSLFGGRLSTYESLLDRGRREAIIRMKQAAQQANAEYVFNVKYTTTNLNAGDEGKMGSIEIFAYGTALIKSAD